MDTLTVPSYTQPRVYTGYWQDHSKSFPFAGTITLSAEWSQILAAIIGAFIPFVGVRLWKILAFCFHQRRCTENPEDALHHQRQVALRNTATPEDFAYTCLYQVCHWWRASFIAVLRSLAWACPPIVLTVAFVVLAAVLPTLISDSEDTLRLVDSDSCGYFQGDPLMDGLFDIQSLFSSGIARTRNLTNAAAAYAEACYSEEPNLAQCNAFKVPRLNRTDGASTDCPFAEEVCLADYQAWRLDTGVLNSLSSFGINLPIDQQVGFRKVATCALLDNFDYTDDVAVEVPTIENDSIAEIDAISNNDSAANTSNATATIREQRWYYSAPTPFGNDTFSQRFDADPNDGYRVETYLADGSQWIPIPELTLSDADTSIVFVALRNTLFTEEVDDPLFSAHVNARIPIFMAYKTDKLGQAIACAEQISFCHSDDSPRGCTALDSISGTIENVREHSSGFTNAQKAVIRRFLRATGEAGSVHHAVLGRGRAALQADRQSMSSTYATVQGALPTDQWQRELTGWFDVSLALLQAYVHEFATGPRRRSFPDEKLNLTADSTDMCGAQLTNEPLGTLNHSVLGIALLFAVGAVIITLSLILEPLVHGVQKLFRRGQRRRDAWARDGVYQLHRIRLQAAFGRELGEWHNVDGNVPYTTDMQKFVLEGETRADDGQHESLRKGDWSESSPERERLRPGKMED